MIILGLNAWHGDAAAALFVDGELVAAAEEERFTRVKHTAGFPARAVRYCLESAGVRLRDLDRVALARDPRARLARKVFHAVRMPGFAIERARVAARFGDTAVHLARSVDAGPQEFKGIIDRVEHHRAHLASAFFASPCERAAVLSLDGFGDFGSGAWGVGEGTGIRVLGDRAFPHSIGMVYTALSQFLGFPRYGDEYKVMGLAAYGAPGELDALRAILRIGGGLRYCLDSACFSHTRTGGRMTWAGGEPVLERLWSDELVARLGPAREPGSPVEPRHADIAASLQRRVEEVLATIVSRLLRSLGEDTLAYAGGVAFNCVANGLLLRETPLRRLALHPASGDAGLAIGAALAVWHERLGNPRRFVMEHTAWGPQYGESDMCEALRQADVGFVRLEPAELVQRVAAELAAGRIVGWYQGRMEWGPRALGQRSILADPRRPDMRDRLNRRIKHREIFRPFAPSVLAERQADWFDGAHPSPFMLIAFPVRPECRERIPAPTHVDGTARLHTVDRATQPLFAALLDAFSAATGVPVLLNTSFNENEPIVDTPRQAIDCWLRTDLDVLALGPFLAVKHADRE